MRRDMTPRETIIDQLGEIDADIDRYQQQIVALRSRRWTLISSLEGDGSDTDELTMVGSASSPRTGNTAWSTLMAEVGPSTNGDRPVVQPDLSFHRPSETYTPVRIHVVDLDESVVPRTRKREINAATVEPTPEVHLHYQTGRFDVALCGATASGDYGWWNTYADQDEGVTLCLSCLSQMRGTR